MDKTPVCNSKYFKRHKEEINLDQNVKTPVFKIGENESPGFPCSQEAFENIDVVWDWNSPQSKRQPKKSQKRLVLSHSPKTTIKRHLSNNSIQGLEKLQEELRLLKQEIAVPEHEESLLLSPVEENEYKNVNNSNSIHNIELENFINEAEDFFDDSLDEQLVICSTQIENKLQNTASKSDICDSNKHISGNIILQNIKESKTLEVNGGKSRGNTNIENVQICYTKNGVSSEEVLKGGNMNQKQNRSENIIGSGKVEFHRTQSFEMSSVVNPVTSHLSTKEEIERRRKEALAKLEQKKKHGSLSVSPMQCSSEEIERKRQEALAKREAKRQQECIERKRQEALKRLEMTRKKNAQMVKSSLSSRLS